MKIAILAAVAVLVILIRYWKKHRSETDFKSVWREYTSALAFKKPVRVPRKIAKSKRSDEDHVVALCNLLNAKPNHAPLDRRHIAEKYFQEKKLNWKVVLTDPDLVFYTATNKHCTITQDKNGRWH